MTDLTDLGVKAIRDGVAARRVLRARSGRGVQRQRRRCAGRAQRLHRRHARKGARSRGRGRCRAREGRAARQDGRRADRHEGPVRHPGRADHRGEPHPRRLRARVRKHRQPKLWDAGRGHAGQAQHGPVRDGLVERDELLRQRRLARGGTSDGGNAALAPGGSSGGSSARRSPRGCARRRPGPTPAARSASPPPSPASRASSRPMAAAAAGASSPSPPASTRPGRWRATSTDCAIMLEAMAGFDPKDSTSLDMPVPDWDGAPERRPARQARRHSARIPDGRDRRRDPRQLGPGHRVAQGCRAPKSSTSACRTPSTRCPPTTSSPPPKRRATSPATTACATACATCPHGANLQDMYAATRAAGFGDEVKRRILIGTYVLSAGLLRRLLHAGAEGPRADRARLRRRLRAVRRDPRADHADRQPSRWATRSTTRWRCI